MTPDERILAEQVGKYEEIVGRLRQENQNLEAKNNELAGQAHAEGFFSFLFYGILVLAATAALGWVAYQGFMADSKVTHCIVKATKCDHRGCDYNLIGNIEWAKDVIMGRYNSFDQAVEKAKKLKCPVEVER